MARLGRFSTAQQALQLRQEISRARGRKLKLRKTPVLLLPRGAERIYRRELLKIIAEIQTVIEQNVFPGLPSIVAEAQFLRPTEDAAFDDAADRIAQLIQATRLAVVKEVTDQTMQNLATRVALLTSGFNREQINKTFRTVLQIDLIGSEPYLQEEINAFVKENVQLIKNIEDQLLADVEQTVFRGVRRGLRAKEIQKEITVPRGVFRKAETRAKLIARDQVSKFNGQLSKLRQVGAGIEKYIWRTSRDERVRSLHAAREGNTFNWENPPSDGHPGEPINCRCWAEPVFEDLL